MRSKARISSLACLRGEMIGGPILPAAEKDANAAKTVFVEFCGELNAGVTLTRIAVHDDGLVFGQGSDGLSPTVEVREGQVQRRLDMAAAEIEIMACIHKDGPIALVQHFGFCKIDR